MRIGKEVINKETEDKIIEEITDKLRLAIREEHINPKSVFSWLNIMYILDMFNSKQFFGELSIRIRGNYMENVKIKEQSNKLEDSYEDFLQKIGLG